MLQKVQFLPVGLYSQISKPQKQNLISGLKTSASDSIEIKSKQNYGGTVLSFRGTTPSKSQEKNIFLRPLEDKKILVGVTGGIAAYKVPDLVNMLVKAGAQVDVIRTREAKKFVTDDALKTMAKTDKIHYDKSKHKSKGVEHVDLAENHDLMIIVPATANTISKLANGITDNLLTDTARAFGKMPESAFKDTPELAFDKKILIVPAMNTNMLHDPAIQKNLQTLKEGDFAKKYTVMDTDCGTLACGAQGDGKMKGLDEIVLEAAKLLKPQKDKFLEGKTIIVTAGGTKERIDPVRYITNDSSGKMGFAIADMVHYYGANVILISTIKVDKPYKVISAESTRDLLEKTKEQFKSADGLIMSAAPADYRPDIQADHKIKRESNPNLALNLVENPDILKEIAKIKKPGQTVVGFAAESDDLIKNAKKKIESKKLDYIVANDISRKDTGFGSDENEATLIDSRGEQTLMPKMSKMEMADMILQKAFKPKDGNDINENDLAAKAE